MREELTRARRVVVKLGTHVVTQPNGDFALGRVSAIVESLANLHRQGYELMLVSSGAVGLGRGVLGLKERPRSLGLKQACAAAGQGRLMALYAQAFSNFDIPAAQVLLAQEDLADADRTLCLRTTLLRLLELQAIPILNENDSVSIRERIGRISRPGAALGATSDSPDEIESRLSFGDNDELSARVAVGLASDLLILLTDVDGVFTANPSEDPNARKFAQLTDQELEELTIDASTSSAGTGGMASKLGAARHAQGMGVDVVIANGSTPHVIERIVAGEEVGTWIIAQDRKNARQRWLASEAPTHGALVVNEGAMRALITKKASLLPVGVVDVVGEFPRASIVEIRDSTGRVFGRGQVNYDCTSIRRIRGARSERIVEILGWVGYDAVINRQNMDIVTEPQLSERPERWACEGE